MGTKPREMRERGGLSGRYNGGAEAATKHRDDELTWSGRTAAPFTGVNTHISTVGTTSGGGGKNPGWEKLPGRRNPAAQNYRGRETRQLKSSGLNPAFQPGVPGCAWG